MRIAISSRNFSGYTGSSRIICGLAGGFIARGDSVDILGNTLNKRAVKACGARPVEIVRFPFIKKLSREAYLKKHQRRAAEAGYDLYVGNGDEAWQDILLLHNCPNLLHELMHGEEVGDSAVSEVSGIHGRILKNRLFKKMVANSKLMQGDISSRYGVPPEMIRVIYPAYDRNVFTPAGRAEDRAAFRAQADIDARAEFLVGLVSSGGFDIRNVKAFFNVIKMLPEELAAKVHLVLVGKDRLENFISERPAGLTHISLSGDPASIMRSLDLMLYPAILETFGLAVAETTACGTPVLTSRRVGASELFTGMHAASLCDRPDEAHFAACLTRFLSERSYREALSAEAPKMLASLSWENYFKEFAQLADGLKRG